MRSPQHQRSSASPIPAYAQPAEPSPQWRKRCSYDNGCVEVARLSPATAGFRDSTQFDGPVLTVSVTAFKDFLERTKKGTFDT